MKKIVRLTESDLVKLVKRVIVEQETQTYKPEDTSNQVQISTRRMSVFPKDRCVASNLVTPYIGRGIVDETNNVNNTLPTKGKKPFTGAVYYVWNGSGVFKPTNSEGVHLVNVCASSNNKGLKPYIDGMPIQGVKTDYKTINY